MEKQHSLDYTQSNGNKVYSFSDLAEALRALQRVCGFDHNHNDIFLACLAAAHEHGKEFSASFADLGARMSGEIVPYQRNMGEGERKKRRHALEQKFTRAYNEARCPPKGYRTLVH